MFLNVDNVGVERMCSGRLFQATGPATQNARLPSCSLVVVGPNRHGQRNGEQKGCVEMTCEDVKKKITMTRLLKEVQS